MYMVLLNLGWAILALSLMHTESTLRAGRGSSPGSPHKSKYRGGGVREPPISPQHTRQCAFSLLCARCEGDSIQ